MAVARNRYIDTLGADTHKKGRVAEELAAAHMRAVGFKDVRLNEYMKGPDITVSGILGRLTVEVKSAVKYVRHKKYVFWLTEKVSERRKDDDFVAIVCPDKSVHMLRWKPICSRVEKTAAAISCG